MGSRGQRRRSRRREYHVFTPTTATPPSPPGGWPAAGSGYEPDPFSPAGTWLQTSKIIAAVGRRGRWFVVPVVVVGLAVALLSLLPR